MKTIWKFLIMAVVSGFVLAVLGVAFGASQAVYLDKTGVHIATYDETRITEPDLGSFKNIDVNVAYSDVEFVGADKYGMDIHSDDGEWDWSLDNGTLKITQNQESNAKINILNFNFDMNRRSSQVTIYLPQGAELENVSVKTSSGDMDIGGFNADDVQIKSSFGKIDIDAIRSDNMQIKINSGDFTGAELNIKNDIVIDSSFGKVSLDAVTGDNMQIDINSGDFTGAKLNAQNIDYKNRFGKGRFDDVSAQKVIIDSNSGDLTFMDCKVGDIDIKNSYGNTTAERLYSSKTNIVANSGNVILDGEFSGETVINSSFGDVNFSTSMDMSYYDYDVSTSFGKVIFDGEKLENNTTLKSYNSADNKLKIEAKSGDVEVRFKK